MVLLGDEAQVDARFIPFRDRCMVCAKRTIDSEDRCMVCAKRTIDSEIVLDTPDATPR
jgi:hypothetical protein